MKKKQRRPSKESSGSSPQTSEQRYADEFEKWLAGVEKNLKKRSEFWLMDSGQVVCIAGRPLIFKTRRAAEKAATAGNLSLSAVHEVVAHVPEVRGRKPYRSAPGVEDAFRNAAVHLAMKASQPDQSKRPVVGVGKKPLQAQMRPTHFPDQLHFVEKCIGKVPDRIRLLKEYYEKHSGRVRGNTVQKRKEVRKIMQEIQRHYRAMQVPPEN